MATTLIDEGELQGLGVEVSVGEIDRALHEIFTGGKEAQENPAGIARASLLNLAVFVEDPKSITEISAIIEELTRETACRAILILSSASGNPAVRSWIQAHCRLSAQGEKTVCTEQVSFLLTGSDASLVRNTVFAHLDSDLPLVFWWRGELSDVFEERLFSRVDRFVFDSTMWAQPSVQFLRLCRAMEDSDEHFIPHDLAYTHSQPIRSMIARIFDDPVARQALNQLQGFEIQHQPGYRISAQWLAAWIAERLGGELEKNGSSADRYRFQKERSREFFVSCQADDRQVEDNETEVISRIR
ncbi:MAG: glucose-6-phosphate dehydrogenase assembly protein OpcA, partial [Verrucomicrobiae bacterium]|nr:glucose-6-phosphate dehydrogenase assembly protein OpcA [Verrucomicrobiae bacterium]